MGLLSIIRKVKRQEREMRLLVVGLDNAGKTTVLKQLTGGDVKSVSPTLGFNIETLQLKGFRLNIWDVGGQKSLRSYWRNYFEQTDGLVWVVDSADRRRLEDTGAELARLLLEERLAGASLLVLANKQDIAGALAPSEIEQVLQLQGLGRRHWHLAGCSAVTGSGVLPAFDWVVEDISKRIYMLD
ncbi:FAP313 [Auxenochlorella protothecoides x Auxenochlorella symbiontica]|uniref:ADP-ribosylation factor-like protein 2 n=1 Tax=Auxenochlorella protothecoides TaxID=3075 RepID=A0A1D1ZSW9_AUXPR